MDETEVAGEAEGRGRGRVEEYWVMELRRAEGNGRDDEEDEEEANGVIGTERVVTEPFRDRLRCTGMGMGCDGRAMLGSDWACT